AAFTIFAVRAHKLQPTDFFAGFSRESALLLNNLLLLVVCGTVLLGTIYPLVLEVINGTKLSVGAPYFNATFNPLAVLLLMVAAISPSIQWKKDRKHSLI